MRLTTILLIIATLKISAAGYSQETNLKLAFQSCTLAELFEAIEMQSDFRIFYKTDQVDIRKVVSFSKTNGTVSDLLTSALDGSDISYKVMDKLIVLTTNTISSQQQKVTGTVTDASSGEPLPGVNIQINGTTQGTTTDTEGKYSLAVSDPSVTLIFSFVGYVSENIPFAGQTVIDVKLILDVTALEEIVVVGYGVQKKSVVTGAISSISAEDLDNSSITRPEQALQGRSSGVQVMSTSGAPGSDMKVRIRGYSSNGKADPLYIVDGVKTPNISYLDPGDISNMEVLKDAASAAIYGAEGGNGVIIITTKKGKTGSSTISYDYQYTIQNVGKVPEMANAKEYATYFNESGTQTIDMNALQYNTNWLDKTFEPGAMQKHYLSLSSGSEKSNFFISLSSLKQDGIIVMDKDKFKRYTVRMNSDNKITDWLKVGYNASFTYTKKNTIPEGSIIVAGIAMDPLTPVSYTGAVPATVQALIDGGKHFVKDENDNYYGVSQYISKNPTNPYVSLAVLHSDLKSYFTQGNIYAELQPIKDFTFTTRFGYEMLLQNTHSWTPVYYYNNFTSYNNATSTSDNNSILSHWQWENFASYSKSLENHNFNILAGISAENIASRYTNAAGGPMIREDENYADLNYISGQKNSTVYGRTYLDRKYSLFGRVSYDYQSKYLLQASIRRDGAGTSYLPKENRFGMFPSFSLGWAFTEESFMPKTFINFGKLRASWGKNGSLSNLSDYKYLSTITSTGVLYTLGDGNVYTVSLPNQLNNPDLKWETSVQTDIGLDLRMLDSRVTFTMDYFYKKTTDLITPNTPPYEAGNTASAVNGGDVLNRGFEFDLGYRNSEHDFKYAFSGNISFLHNEVTYLNPTIQRINSEATPRGVITAFEEGYPVWYMRGYKTNGINETTGAPNFVDQNSDGLINENDKVMLGSAIPDITYGGNINLSWKGLDFVMSLQGQIGNEGAIVWYRGDWPGMNVPKFLYDDRWTSSNTDATQPKPGFVSNTYLSDLFVFDGSFMRIKQIQLGYTLPASLLQRIKTKSARIYISVDDYFTFTKFPGMDPELGNITDSNIGLDQGMYPITKKVLFGLSVTL